VPVLINTARSIDEDFASPLEFDHMIALAPKGQAADGTWMDATLEVAPLGMLGSNTRDRRSLALAGDSKAELVRTPADSPVPSVNEIALDGAVNVIGVLDARVSITVRGDRELIGRALVRAMPRIALKDFVTAVAASNGITGEISEPATSDPADSREPFRVSFRVRTRGFLDWAAARSELTVPPHDSLPYAKEADRKDLHRLHFTSTSTSRLRITIDLPSGYEAAAPQPLRVSRAGLTYTSDYRVEGSRLHVERETKIAVRDVPEAAFGEYASVASALDADAKQHFTVRGTTTGTPAIPDDATADELYKAGRSAWDAKRYEAAAAIYKRTTELAPKMGDAWIALGLAYDQLDKHDEAAAAIQKQIDLDPYNKRAHGDLGRVLDNGGKKELAIKAYARHTELNALDGDAFKELGILYVETSHYAEAIAPLEKALDLLPRDAWVPANLVEAYLNTKQPDKASKAVDRVIDRKPGAEVREYVAWRMAQHGLDLARAEELARGAEKDFLSEFRDLDLKSVTQRNLDHVDRLAWAWDAIGWIDFQHGKLTEADAYVRAAWQLIGDVDVAYHLGQICEKRDKLADAMNYYLTAQALDDDPPADLVARVKKLAGGGDLSKMLASARQMAPLERSFQVSSGPSGTAAFLAIVDNGRKAVDVRFASGDDSLKPLAEQTLRSMTLPVLFPTDAPVRIPLGLRVQCRTTACRGIVEFPRRIKLSDAAAQSAR
jgi:tetratricopeptide (TPR) repeat protein